MKKNHFINKIVFVNFDKFTKIFIRLIRKLTKYMFQLAVRWLSKHIDLIFSKKIECTTLYNFFFLYLYIFYPIGSTVALIPYVWNGGTMKPMVSGIKKFLHVCFVICFISITIVSFDFLVVEIEISFRKLLRSHQFLVIVCMKTVYSGLKVSINNFKVVRCAIGMGKRKNLYWLEAEDNKKKWVNN